MAAFYLLSLSRGTTPANDVVSEHFHPDSFQRATSAPTSSVTIASPTKQTNDNGTILPPNEEHSSSRSPSSDRKKRHRTSTEQRNQLEKIFQSTKTPNQSLREHLASQLGMSPRRIQIWFQNKRAKLRKSVANAESPQSNVPPAAIPIIYPNNRPDLPITQPLFIPQDHQAFVPPPIQPASDIFPPPITVAPI